MYGQDKDLLYYIAIYNENHPMPPKPEGVDEGIIRGMYRLRGAPKGDGPVVRLVASGPIMLQAFEAVELLEEFGVNNNLEAEYILLLQYLTIWLQFQI